MPWYLCNIPLELLGKLSFGRLSHDRIMWHLNYINKFLLYFLTLYNFILNVSDLFSEQLSLTRTNVIKLFCAQFTFFAQKAYIEKNNVSWFKSSLVLKMQMQHTQ